jgi:hypothetical protein
MKCKLLELADLAQGDGLPSEAETLRAAAVRIAELEGIIRASFVAWDTCGTDGLVLTRQDLSEETSAAIIDICKPRSEAPTATGDD